MELVSEIGRRLNKLSTNHGQHRSCVSGLPWLFNASWSIDCAIIYETTQCDVTAGMPWRIMSFVKSNGHLCVNLFACDLSVFVINMVKIVFNRDKVTVDYFIIKIFRFMVSSCMRSSWSDNQCFQLQWICGCVLLITQHKTLKWATLRL